MKKGRPIADGLALALAVVWFAMMAFAVTAKGHEQPDECWDIQECEEAYHARD